MTTPAGRPPPFRTRRRSDGLGRDPNAPKRASSLPRRGRKWHSPADISSDDAATGKKSQLVQHGVLIETTASALVSSLEETQRSLRPPEGQDLMASLLKTISSASGMPLTLWTSGGVISGATTSLADFFSSAVDHLEDKVSGEHHALLRQQSVRLTNAVLPDVVLLATAQGQKIAVRVEDISAWTLGSE